MTSTPLDYWINTDFSAPSQVALDNSQGKEKKMEWHILKWRWHCILNAIQYIFYQEPDKTC